MRTLVLVFLIASAAAHAETPDAKQMFTSRCAICHGKTGVPNEGFAKKGVRDLTRADWQKSKSDEDIKKAILDGRQGTLMASFREAFTPEEVDALVRFIRSLEQPAK